MERGSFFKFLIWGFYLIGLLVWVYAVSTYFGENQQLHLDIARLGIGIATIGVIAYWINIFRLPDRERKYPPGLIISGLYMVPLGMTVYWGFGVVVFLAGFIILEDLNQFKNK